MRSLRLLGAAEVAASLLSPALSTQAAEVRTPCVPPQGTTLVEFQSAGNMLRGFIDLPESRDKHPAILIVHGGVDTDVTVDPYYEEMRRGSGPQELLP